MFRLRLCDVLEVELVLYTYIVEPSAYRRVREKSSSRIKQRLWALKPHIRSGTVVGSREIFLIVTISVSESHEDEQRPESIPTFTERPDKYISSYSSAK